MRKTISFILSLVLVLGTLSFGAFTASAAESGSWDTFTWTFDEGVLTVNGDGYMTNPEFSYEEGWSAFGWEVQKIVIGDGILSICSIFSDCYEAKLFRIGKDVTKLEGDPFSGINYLENFEVDEGNTTYCAVDGILFNKDKTALVKFPRGKEMDSYTVPDGVTALSNFAFRYCTSLKEVVIPDGVTGMGIQVFEYSSIERITIGKGITDVDDGAFSGSSSLTEIKVDSENAYLCDVDGVLFSKDKTAIIRYPEGKEGSSYTIPDSVTRIKRSAFSGVLALTDVTIPESVVNIGAYAFSETTMFYDESNWENGAFYIDDCLLESLYGIEECVIREGTRVIAGYAFYGNEVITEATIPDSVTVIDEYAFGFCYALESVTIGKGVTTIGDGAFCDCYSIDTVNYTGSREQWESIEKEGDSDYLLGSNVNYNYGNGEKGDTNGDGYVDNMDAAMILKYDAGITDLNEAQQQISDVNSDGFVDNMDAARILKYDAGLIQQL